MKKEDALALKAFEVKVRTLLDCYKNLQKENADLRAMLEMKERERLQTIEATNKIKREFEYLKMAKMLTVSNNDLGKAKSEIDKLIRKIDKCMALLNV